MKTYRTIFACVCLTAALALGGCGLRAVPLDADALNRYQQYGLHNSPPARQDELRPVPGSTGVPLEVKIDEQTGRKYLELTIEEAVYRTLLNNVDVKVIAFDPAISRERYIQALSVFDTIVSSGFTFDKADSRGSTTFVSSKSETYGFEAAVRQPLTTGGDVTVAYEMTRNRTNLATGFTAFNPVYRQVLAVELTQPLLRNAGPDFTLAQIRVARANHEISLAQFRAQVLDVINQVQALYWQLVRAHQELEIQEELLRRTQETYQQVVLRMQLDASAVQVTQSAAAVETRRATLITARKAIGDIQDQLVRTMADASITLLDDVLLVPVSEPSQARVTLDRADQVALALKYSPELEQARLAILVNDVNVRLARNQTLPRLDLTAGAGLNGVDNHWTDSWNTLSQGNYIDYNVGLVFEYPLANRQRRAALREAQFTRYRSVAVLQNTADGVAVAVNEAIRQIDSTYEQIAAQAAAVNANRDYLDSLIAREEVRQALTPEFLQLKLGAQESLAAAARALRQAVVDFNIAQAQLGRAAGTSLELLGVEITDAGEDFVRLLSEQTRLPDMSVEGTMPRPVQMHLPPTPLTHPIPDTQPQP